MPQAQGQKKRGDSFKPLTFEDYLERCRRALITPAPMDLDEMGRITVAEFPGIPQKIDQRYLKYAIQTVLGKAKDAGIEVVVADGFSGKPAAHFFQKGWEQLYGPDGVPKMFALGDSLVDTPGEVHLEQKLERLGNQRIYQLTRGEGVDVAAKRVSERFPDLMRYKDRPVLFMTEYVDKGKTFKAIEQVFKHLGFSDINFGTLVCNMDQFPQAQAGELHRLETFPWIGREISAREHIDYPAIPWLHLRSDLYNELKRPESERDAELISRNRTLIKQTYKDLAKLAKELGQS